jgi:hypothetical protein
MSDTKSKIPNPRESKPASEDFVPIALSMLPEPEKQFSSEGFVPTKGDKK